MRVNTLLQKCYQKSRKIIDKRLHRILMESVQTLMKCKHLSIFGLGRALNRKTSVKHNIKTINRLFGNKQLHKQKFSYYKDIAQWLVKNNKQPKIIIDWSRLSRCGKFNFIRASIPMGGRALPILDMTFELKDYTKPCTHKKFIKELKAILPEGCQPIIITDAGFRCTWFKLIREQGWDYIGRVRNRTHYQDPANKQWFSIKSLYNQATLKAQYLFESLLAKSNPEQCYFYLMHGKKKHRIKKNLTGKRVRCSASKKHAKREREPWLIVSSLSPEDYSAKQIMALYKKRMQVEEGFRDLKNTKNGFSLRHCRSYSVERLNVALLIAALAMLILWVIGSLAKANKIHFSYQANSIKSYNVLSCFTIGWQAVFRNDVRHFLFDDALCILNNLHLSQELI